MSDRERAIQLLNTLPEYQLGYVIAYMQGIHDSMFLPNQETEEAIDELKNGGGHKFSGTTDDLFDELGA